MPRLRISCALLPPKVANLAKWHRGNKTPTFSWAIKDETVREKAQPETHSLRVIHPWLPQTRQNAGCLESYVMLVDWTGRELRADRRGAIPDHLAPIVDRLGINRSNWVETVRGFGRLFKQAAGRPSSLVDAAARRSRRWFQGKAAARTAFV
jgi:hypothetical protein